MPHTFSKHGACACGSAQACFSYTPSESVRSLPYSAVALTIAPNVFEAVMAEALHAMGITAPRARLHEKLRARGINLDTAVLTSHSAGRPAAGPFDEDAEAEGEALTNLDIAE